MSPPAVVVLDPELPKLEGEEVAAGLRLTHGGGVPVVVITGLDERRAAEQCHRIGAFVCLRKPFELDDLVEAVRGALADRRPPQ